MSIDYNKQSLLIEAIILNEKDVIELFLDKYEGLIDVKQALFDSKVVNSLKNVHSGNNFINLVQDKVGIENCESELKELAFKLSDNSQSFLISKIHELVNLSGDPEVIFNSISFNRCNIEDKFSYLSSIFDDFPNTRVGRAGNHIGHYLAAFGVASKVLDLKDAGIDITGLMDMPNNYGVYPIDYIKFPFLSSITKNGIEKEVVQLFKEMKEVGFKHVPEDVLNILFSKCLNPVAKTGMDCVKHKNINIASNKDLMVFKSAIALYDNCEDDKRLETALKVLGKVIKLKLDKFASTGSYGNLTDDKDSYIRKVLTDINSIFIDMLNTGNNLVKKGMFTNGNCGLIYKDLINKFDSESTFGTQVREVICEFEENLAFSVNSFSPNINNSTKVMRL